MKILKEPNAFHVITTMALHPCFDEREVYAQKLKELNMYEEAEELYYVGECEFEELLDLYEMVNNKGLMQ